MNEIKKCVHLKETLKGCTCAFTDYEICPNPWAEKCDVPEQHYYEQMGKEELEEE